MEPNFWLDFGVWGVGMMANQRHAVPVHIEHDDDAEKDITFGQFVRRWGHLSVTVTIAIFLFTQWQISEKERSDMEKQIAINTAVIARLMQDNRDQDIVTKGNLDALGHRLDLQRSDISALQSQFIEHFSKDERRFKAVGVQ